MYSALRHLQCGLVHSDILLNIDLDHVILVLYPGGRVYIRASTSVLNLHVCITGPVLMPVIGVSSLIPQLTCSVLWLHVHRQ